MKIITDQCRLALLGQAVLCYSTGATTHPRQSTMPRTIDPADMIDFQVGLLTVTSYAGCVTREYASRTRHIHRYGCRCSCGNTVVIDRMNLRSNHTTSCGCLKTRRGAASPTWNGHGKISGRFWTHIQYHAESRGIPFDLTIEQAWDKFVAQEGRCALTGWEISPTKHKINGKYTIRTASLDRIDSSKSYTPDNIQWLHKKVNKSKMEFGQKDFITMCRAVASWGCDAS